MSDKLLALMAKYQLQFQWEDPNDTASEFMEPEDDPEPCTLNVTSAKGTTWSADFENTEAGRREVLQQFMLDAEDYFLGDVEGEDDTDDESAEDDSFSFSEDNNDKEQNEAEPLSIDEEEG